MHGFAADPRRLVAGIGPAGAGKTTAMQALAEARTTTGRRVVPLAPSAAAADVLESQLGCRAENLHKFHHAHTSNIPTDDPWFTLQPGDVILVDEAGMAGTIRLEWLTTYARERGALVRLLGDPSQLTAVEAGGALRLIVNDVGPSSSRSCIASPTQPKPPQLSGSVPVIRPGSTSTSREAGSTPVQAMRCSRLGTRHGLKIPVPGCTAC